MDSTSSPQVNIFKIKSSKYLLLIAVILIAVIQAHEITSVSAEEVLPDSPPQETAPVEVETGDALAETDISSDVNTNVVETDPVLLSPTDSEQENSEQDSALPEESNLVLEAVPPTLDISNNSEALIENEATTTAMTGENNASSTGETQIKTGDAYASSNVLSVANVNLVESNGFLYLLNNFLMSLGHVDLRSFASSVTSPQNTPCDTSTCDSLASSLSVEDNNQAEILNVIITRSLTGGNSATGTDAHIATGNAYAGANVVNIANTNIINSNYLLFAFNNFGGWDGDLIFPNADFFSSFFSNSSHGNVAVTNNNTADVETDVEVVAESGTNEADGGESVVETGAALAGSNVSNIVNTNLFNSPTFFVVFRIFGSWNGSVFNAPEEIKWAETPSGIQLLSSNEEGDSIGNGGGNMDIESNNDVHINNKLKVFALTGDNKIRGGNASSAVINTGNAYAGANVVNVANANIVSSNWIMALVNIFGDWNGNISFGQPDIWVATRVEGPEVLNPGSEAIFHTTIANRGDARASNVRFNGSFDSPVIAFRDEEVGEAYSIDVGSLAPGEVKELTYSAIAMTDIPIGDSLVEHTFEVSANETDGNPADNVDIVSLLIHRTPPSGRVRIPGKPIVSTYPNLSITKTHSATTTIMASSTVDYTIKVMNTGGSAFAGVLHDVLKDEEGTVISKHSWDLGEIFYNEEITVTYTAIFSASTTLGLYTNSAWVEAYGGDYEQNPVLGTDASSNIATSHITVGRRAIGDGKEIAESGEICSPYLNGFIRQGMENDPQEVEKLQEFLNKEMDAELPVTGFYGPLTYQATKDFQKKHADKILEPWGLETPTGIVYQTTQRWINLIECPGLALETPTLIAWSNNPNAPAMLARTNLNPISKPTLSVGSEDDGNENIPEDGEEDTNLALSIKGFFFFLKNIFR